jgi:16S rRNA (guanine(527)-N(7))-methyltransferase RsmG
LSRTDSSWSGLLRRKPPSGPPTLTLEAMFHVKHSNPTAWDEAARRLGLALDEGALGRLVVYEALLLERAVPAGLIAPGDAATLRERHVLDALRGARLLDPPSLSLEGPVVDLGSGAGLPGIPLGIVRPEVRFVLTEVRRSRVAFLELAVDHLGLPNMEVWFGRAEDLADPEASACTARAFGDLGRSWDVCRRLLASGAGRLLYWAGRRWQPPAPPPEVSLQVVETRGVANTGPIVIMSRQ